MSKKQKQKLKKQRQMQKAAQQLNQMDNLEEVKAESPQEDPLLAKA